MTATVSSRISGPERPILAAGTRRSLAARIGGWLRPARGDEEHVFVDDMTPRDWFRIGLSVAICGALFLSDIVTPVEMNEGQLYPLALLPLYRVPLRFLLPAFSLLSIALLLTGYAVSPDVDFWDGLSNKTFSIVMIVVTAICLTRLATTERKLMLRALTDPLTGVFNRRTFLELSGREEARARRRGSLTSVLMMDIDHFKRINDAYGHPVGDQVIKALADGAAKALRPTDILARYGGEEFVVTLPDTDSELAERVAERLRATLERLTVRTEDGTQVRFTISVGVATFATGVPLTAAMERADQALYRAKQNGRNRVEKVGLLEARAS